MASGNIYNTFHNGGYRLNVAWNSTTTDASNSSVVTATITLVCSSGYGLQISSRTNSITIDGTSYSFTSPAINTSGGSTITLGTVTSNSISHNSDGSKAVSISCSFNIRATLNGTYYTTWTTSGTATLDSVAKKVTITSAPNFNESSNPTITYSNPAGSAATSVQACIADSGGKVIFVPYRDISKTGTSYTFNLTSDERAALIEGCGSNNSMLIAFYIRSTINGVTYFSYMHKTFTIADSSITISASVRDTNATTVALTGDDTVFIRFFSSAAASMTPSSNAAIDLDSCIIQNGGVTGFGTSHTFTNIESNIFTFYAEDARGNSGSKSITVDMINYVRLTCDIGNEKPDTSGNMTLTCSGNYFNGSFGNASNTLTVQYRYKTQGGSFGSWRTMTASKSGHSYTASASLSGLDYRTTYVFEARATDKLATVSSAESSVKSTPVFHWSESDFVFEVPVTFNAGTNGEVGGGLGNTIEGDCTITGNLRLKGDGNYGNALFFGDGSYAYISEPTDDDLVMRASNLNIIATDLQFNDRTVKYGSWTPSLSSSAISSYSVRQGWYQKLGSVVTIGWNIKATCNSGYQTTVISIGGIPYPPAYDASGGGICSGAYISANHNFECWVASTSETITARIQGCNHTVNGNLSTSASGLYYRSGGGEITLGGTISYVTNEI